MKHTLKQNKSYTIETETGTEWNKVFKDGKFHSSCLGITTAYQVIYKLVDGKHGILDEESFSCYGE